MSLTTKAFGFALVSVIMPTRSAACQSPIYALRGEGSRFDSLGFKVTPVGDVDRDGVPDVAAASLDYVRFVSGRYGCEVATLRGPVGLAVSVSRVGDTNADGWPDFALVHSYQATAEAEVYSGKDFSSLFRVTLVSFPLGTACSAGDIDVDGCDDFIISEPWVDSQKSGLLRWYSGRTHQVLRTTTRPYEWFGVAMAAVGDIDSDGFADVAVVGTLPLAADSVSLLSGRTGNTIRRASFPGLAISEVAACGDIDRDGVPDVVCGGIDYVQTNGVVYVLSGRSLVALATHVGAPGDWLGFSVDGAGDVDADGYPDYVAGAPHLSSLPVGPRYARLYSGRTHKTIFTLTATSAMSGFGQTVRGTGDLDGDGVPDIAVAADGDSSFPGGTGTVRVYSGRHLPLTTDNHLVTVTAGGAQQFALDAEVPYAGRLYLLLGTYHGTKPGIQIGSVNLPLNFDEYFAFTLATANQWIRNSIGFLDQAGRARADVGIPPLSPALAGTVVHHAFVTFTRDLTRIDFASNPVPLSLQK